MTSFCMHRGARIVSRNDLLNSVTPEGLTATHTPIAHSTLVDLVAKQIEASGYRIAEEQHALHTPTSKDNENPIIDARYFGLFKIRRDDDDNGTSPAIAVVNSHDQRLASRIGVGTNVFVCDNLAFIADVKLGRKHTMHIVDDLPQLVENVFTLAAKQRVLEVGRVERYKGLQLTDQEASHFIMRAVKEGAMPKQKTFDVFGEWLTPSYDAFTENGRSLWRLFNAHTELYKGMNPNDVVARSQVLYELADNLAA